MANSWLAMIVLETPLTKALQEEGCDIHFEDNLDLVPEELKSKENVLIIYTPAIPKEHSELNYFQDHDFKVKKRSQVLGLISKSMFTVAVAGTHGKTTTSSMIAHILRHNNVDCTGFLGGISQNYNTNMLINEGKNAVMVVEADEFDRSFLQLHPDVAVITSTDADHLDVYGERNALLQSFNDFTRLIADNGSLYVCDGIEKDLDITNENRNLNIWPGGREYKS